MPADTGFPQRERSSSALRRSRCDSGSGLSLRSETACLFVPPPASGHPQDSPLGRSPAYGLPPSPCCRTPSRAHGRLWRFVAQAQPFARLLLVAGSSRNTGVLAAPSPAPTPPSTHGLSPALRSRTYAANPPARIGRCSRWSARLRLRYAFRSNAAGLAVLNPDAPLFVARPPRGHPRFSPLLPQNRHPGPTPKLRPFSRCRAPSGDFLPAKPHPDGCLILYQRRLRFGLLHTD